MICHPDAAPYRDDRPDDAALDLDHAAIHHLKQAGWTLSQIAAFVGRDRVTITQVLRTAVGTAKHAPTAAGAAPPLTIRLSRDACRLQIVLPADGLPTPTALLLAQIQAHCAGRHIALALTAEDLERRLRTCVYGAWLTIAEATRPTPPRPERVRVLVPVPLAGRRRDEAGPRAAVLVRRGTVLARREAGAPGQPGRDLLGRALPPRQPRPARLPQGQNTALSADGQQLRAACDGRVLLRHLRLHVLPATIHEGDLTAADGVLRAGVRQRPARPWDTWDTWVRPGMTPSSSVASGPRRGRSPARCPRSTATSRSTSTAPPARARGIGVRLSRGAGAPGGLTRTCIGAPPPAGRR